MTRYTKRNPYIIAGDFETDYDEETGRRYICEWAMTEGGDFCWKGRDQKSFEDQLMKIVHGSDKTPGKRHVMIYFHNIKYDSSYIMDFFVRLVEEKHFKCFKAVDDMKAPVFLMFSQGDDRNPHTTITFRDSKRKFNTKLKAIGKMLKMDKLRPDDEDFTPGWSKRKDYSDPHAMDYVCQDARIVAKAMRELHEGVDGFNFDAPTISADAWNLCVKVCEEEWTEGYRNECHRLGITPTNEMIRFKGQFPPLPVIPVDEKGETEALSNILTEEEYEDLVGMNRVTDNEIREAYWGGINYSNKGGELLSYPGHKIHHIDYHSMYPSQMMYRLLPYGSCTKVLSLDRKPKAGKDYDPEKQLYVTEIFVTKMKLKPGMIPWYHIKDGNDKREEDLRASEPVTELKHPHVFTVTSVELEDLELFYDMEFSYDLPIELRQTMFGAEAPSMEYIIRPRTWIYNAKVGKLKKYIDVCYEKKQYWGKIDKGGLWYMYWKTLMNSLYGRLAMNPYRKEADFMWNEETETYVWNLPCETRHVMDNFKSYVPYSAFVCAWARHQLTQAWLTVGCENVIHSDTDSIVYIGDEYPEGLKVTKDELDTWGDEALDENGDTAIKKFIAGGTKLYIEIIKPLEEFKPGDRMKDYVNTAMAGIPKDTKVINGIEVPVGMWVPLLDRPTLIAEDFDLGDEHYSIQSKWLRDLYVSAGLDPDNVDTTKLQTRHVSGGIDLVKSRFKKSSGFSLKWR